LREDEQMPFYVVDRIEGKTAVVLGDDGLTFDVPRPKLPKACREGTVVRIDTASRGTPIWEEAVIDEAERARRLEKGGETLRRLRQTDPGGDIEL